jgi:iron complex outermembrane receptor protein
MIIHHVWDRQFRGEVGTSLWLRQNSGRGFVCVIFILLFCAAAAAQDPADLTSKSLEELMNVTVTTASKKEEKLFRTPAAIYVITQDEIRRSGMTSIPELLRLVPGLDVARIDGTKWAISARGFNGRFASQLLVMIDGRTVFTPQTSGVNWEVQNLMLEDVERIEVVRGPGGTLWGANAVNGVINIITKRAKDTQGGLVVAGSGSEDRGFGSLRYGGRIGDSAYYRAYGQYFNTSGLVDGSGAAVHDGRQVSQGGGRIDWTPTDRDSLTFQADIFYSNLRERPTAVSLLHPFTIPASTGSDLSGGNVMGRWSHAFSDRSDMTLQAYFDRNRNDGWSFQERLDTFDVDFQHHIAAGQRHDIVWGLGYRRIWQRTDGNSGDPVLYIPPAKTVQLFSAFFEDQIALVKGRLQLTLGAKLEHNDFSGFEIQPSARLLWTPSARQTFWAAISRAVTTPAFSDAGLRANLAAFPGQGGITNVLTLFGDIDGTVPQSVIASEFGYRIQASKRVSIDLATFYNVHRHLQTNEPGAPFLEADPLPVHLVIPISFEDLMHGRSYGVETAANFDLATWWKARASYSFLRVELHRDPTSQDDTATLAEGDSPRHQFQVHSEFRLPHNLEAGASLFYVSRLLAQPVPSYTRLDARVAWRVAEGIELSAVFQNLLDSHHPEFLNNSVAVRTSEAKRGAYGKITWRF